MGHLGFPPAGKRGRRFDWNRRDVLRAGNALISGVALGGARARAAADERSIIWLMLVGGPSPLETFDPKPDAPDRARGPFESIATRIPGVRIGEHLPRIAGRLHRLALIRTLHHDAAPIHETGLQLVQTGRLARPDDEPPHVGAVVSGILGRRGIAPPFVVLPGPIRRTGVAISHGQASGWLGPDCGPAETGASSLAEALDDSAEPGRVRDAYGATCFGRDCLRARRLVEAGARVIVVNMYESVFDGPSWDVHGRTPFATFDDYARVVLPTFDRAFAALVDDLEQRGRLAETLVIACGEFGRSPRINESGGRDHATGAWPAVLAGGRTPGGIVIGTTDRHGAEPSDRPVAPVEIVATAYAHLGIDPTSTLLRADGASWPLVDGHRPLAEWIA